jgi:hypothetical protein
MSIREDLIELEHDLKNSSDLDIIESLWAYTDSLVDDIEERLGRFNDFDVTVARLKMISNAMIPIMRRLKTAP